MTKSIISKWRFPGRIGDRVVNLRIAATTVRLMLAYESPSRLFIFLLLTGIMTPLHAEINEALNLLGKMMVAEQTLNYEGTVVYQSGHSRETIQVVHSFDQYGERERLSMLAGTPREMVRDDKHVFFILPSNRFVLIESRYISEDGDIAFPSVAGEAAFYEIGLNGTEQIAGYSCQVLGITPKDNYRYGYRFCIEDETGLLLKSQTLDGDGRPQEEMVFTHLQLPDSIPTERLQTTLHEEDFTLLQSKSSVEETPENPGSKNLDSPWRLNDKPPGFSVTRNEMRQIASSEEPVRYIILDDGIASVSVFIEHLERGAPQRPIGATRSGALSILSKVQDNFMVTVIGEVPGSTIEMIARSLHYQPEEGH